MRGVSKVAIVGAALAAILALTMAGCCGGSSDTSGTSTGTGSTAATDNAAGGGDIAAEVASKGTAVAVRDRLKGQVCDSSNRFKTPYIDFKEQIRPYADKVLYGSWIDPGIPELNSSQNDKVQNFTVEDLDWYGALDALCNPATTCQGDVCELTEPELYAKTRVEFRMINNQPRIVSAFRGMSIGGANTPLLETAYATFVATTTAQLPPGAAGAPPAPPAGAPPAPPAPPAAQ
jgi:hypothetical protein